MSLQQMDLSGADVVVDAYACLDVSGAIFVDSSGVDVTPPDRPSILPIELAFRSMKHGLYNGGGSSPVLLLERSEPWTGQEFCS
jgi:hypothetical protein